MDQVPGPIRVDQVTIKVEKTESNETQNFPADTAIITKQEAIFYPEEEEEDDDDDGVLEECDIPIKQEPGSHLLKDPLSIEDEILYKNDIVKEEMISDVCHPVLSSVITPPPNPSIPFGRDLKALQHSKNLMFFLFNQQIFVMELPPDAMKDPSKFKIVIQPPLFNKSKTGEVVSSFPPPLTPISGNDKSYANVFTAQLDVTSYIYICYYCNGRSSNKEELQQHILQVHMPYLRGGCFQPTVPMSTIPSMIPKKPRNTRARKERTIYECTYCSYSAPRPCMVKDHIAAKHTFEKPYKCELCDYRSSSKGLVLGHIKSKHGIKQFKCDQCDYRAAQFCKVKYHIEAKHSQIKKYKCPHCDYQAVHAAGIRGHIVIQHEKGRTFHCPYCGYITRQAKGLQTHVLAKHTEDRPFRCQECDYGAVSNRNLKYHMMTKHTNERPFPCHECPYKAISSNSLKKHFESKHLELKQYSCDHCDYKTSRPLVLKKHIQSKHLGEKPYQCYHCGYGTVWLGNLKLHIRSKHNKDRWYRCSYCYFRTFISKNLKTHVEMKHIRNGKLVFKPKRGRGRPRGSGKSCAIGKPCGTGRPRGRPRKVLSNSESKLGSFKIDLSVQKDFI